MLKEQGSCEFRMEILNANGGDTAAVICKRRMGITTASCVNMMAEQSECKFSSMPLEDIPRTSPTVLMRNIRRRTLDESFMLREEQLREF